MKNKNLIYLLVLIILLGVAGWLISTHNKTTTLERPMNYDFTIKDTAAIDKITISDKSPAEVTLTRDGNRWMVNGNFKAREDAINTLLETLYRMEMRNFIPKRMQETVNKRMAVFGNEVNIYKNGKLFKTIYVGTETQDQMATYMMIEGSDAPYAVYIPGFNGFLSTRFFTDEHLWRSRDITLMDPRHIKSVEMIYPDSTEASFRLEVFSRDSLILTKLSNGRVMQNVDLVKMRVYLNAASNMKYEGEIVSTDPIWARRDSLLASVPVFKMSVKDFDGNTTTVQGYNIKGPQMSFDPEVEAPEYDPDRMHGFINEERMVLLQYYGLRHVLKPLQYFTKP